MSVDFNGTNAKLQLSSISGLSYPISIFCWLLPDTTNTNYMVAGFGEDGGGRELMLYAEGAGSGKMRAFARTPSTGPNSTTSVTAAWTPALAVYTSDTSRTVYYGAGASVTDTTALDSGTIAALSRLVVGVRGIDESLFFAGLVAHVAVWSGGSALGQTQFDALAGGAVPSTVSSGTLWDYWALATSASTHTGTNGRVLTAFGGVSTGASNPPVGGASFGAGATLAAIVAAGSLTTTASGFTSAATLGAVVAAGSLGATAGTITSEPLRTNNGTLLASVALSYVAVYNQATGALVVRKTGVSTNGSGVFSFSDPAIAAGTTYRVDWETAAGQRRMPLATAA